jgi:NAD(P)-dependent dehydrogenase (short-subunit alcohol dehydrogenase family)
LPSSSDAALAGMVVICTGGGSGIGRAAVDAFVTAGARVAVLERDSAKAAALDGLGDAVAVVNGDATTANANAELVALAMDRWNRVDVAVTFVGVFDLYTPLIDIDDDRFDPVFDEIFAVNVKSPLLTARAAAPALRQSKGSIIFTLSSSSFYTGRGGTLYVGSKFALRGVVKQLAHELAPDVRVNGVAPGGTVGTDLRGPRSLDLDSVRLDDRPGRAEQISARTPLHVALTPVDHAALYVFLASRASVGMTGEILRSDGGIGVR